MRGVGVAGEGKCGAYPCARRNGMKALDGHIDTVIGLPANLFYSTGIPVCILVLEKCKKPDDLLFINAAEHFEKGKRQNRLTQEHTSTRFHPQLRLTSAARSIGSN